MKSRQYYESLSDQQLVDEARFDARAGRPTPELMLVLSDRVEDLSDEVGRLDFELFQAEERINDLELQLGD